MTMINRANRYYCNDYQEVAIVPIIAEEAKRGKKGVANKDEYLTRPEQRLVNDRNTYRWMRIALQGNFGKGDYHFVLTFKSGELPPPEKAEEAKKVLSSVFLRKCREKYKAINQPFKYIWVMEYELTEDDDYLKRVHFHIIINRVPGISRDDIEDCWAKGKGKSKKILGAVHTKRLISFNGAGLEALAKYLSKGMRWVKGKKVWNSSRNLKKIKKRKRDKIFSHKQMEKMALSNDQGAEIIAKKYPNYDIVEIEFKHNEYKGWHLYLKMWKKERAG